MEKREKVVKYLLIALVVIGVIWIIYSLINSSFHGEQVFQFKFDSLEIKVNEKMPIDYELSDNLDIKWESDDNSVAIVNDGIVSGMGLGNAVIKGTVIKDGKEIIQNCYVSTYIGDKNIGLTEILISEGEIFITKGDSFKVPFEYNPSTAYIKSIDYSVVDDIVATFDGTLVAKNTGTTDITITANKSISKTITVNVIDNVISPTFSKKINEITLLENSLSLKIGENKKMSYTIEPEDAFIGSVKWGSSNPNVADVNEEGLITAKTQGKTIIKLIVNDSYIKEIEVSVNVPVSGIKLNSNPKLVLKVGSQETIRTTISPANATNKKVKYINSNANAVSVNAEGLITAKAAGSGYITIQTEDGDYQTVVSYTVNPKTGVINGMGDVWGYTSPNDVTPVRADLTFFQKLASNGKGILNGNVYIYNDTSRSYKYDISKSILTTENKEILMRMYYPSNANLSEVNTFTIMGGTGPSVVNFGAFLGDLDRNRNYMSTSGIIILVSTTIPNRYETDHVILSTEFVKSIVNQKSWVKNAVGGYSGSGWTAGTIANTGSYDRLIIGNSNFHADKTPNVKSKEVIVYLPNNDSVINGTTTLNYMSNLDYSNVTVISNINSVVNNSKYISKFLIINPGGRPGGTAWSGHGYANLVNAHIFSYACR